MSNSFAFSKKAFTWTVVVATIAWAMSAAFVAIPLAHAATLTAGDLIRGTVKSPYGGYPVYYYGSDGKRHLFPTASTYYSWYGTDFSSVRVLTEGEVGAISLGMNVFIRPGSNLIKDEGSDPKVYVVAASGTRRYVASESVASSLYGATWSRGIVLLPTGFFSTYTEGTGVTMASDYDKAATLAAASNVGVAMGLGSTPVVTGALSVAASSENPSGSVLPLSASSVVVLKFNISAGDAAQTVTGVTVKSIGVGASADFSNVYLFDGAMRLTSGRTLGSQTRSAEFAGLNLSIPANGTKTLAVVVDVAATGTATAGDTHAFQVTSLGTTASVSGIPLTGATFSTASLSVSNVQVSNGTTPSNPTIGQTGVPVGEFRLTAGANDVEFRRVTVTVGGQVSTTDISNYALYQAGTKVADGVRNSDRVTFDLSAAPFTITQGANRNFTIKADVGGRGSRTLITYIDSVYPSDLLVVDKLYGYGAAVNWGANTVCDAAEFCSAANGMTVTTQGGRVTVAFNGPPAADASVNSQDVPFLKFSLSAGEQAIEVRNLRLNLAEAGAGTAGVLRTSATNNYFSDIKIKDADTGAVVMGPVELSSATLVNETSITAASAATWTLTGTWTLNASQTRRLVVTADLANITTTDFATRGYAFTLWPTAPTANAFTAGDFREVSTGQNVATTDVIGAQSAITGNTVTVRASSLAAALASSPVSGTTVKGTTGVSSVGYALTAGTSSNVKVTQVIVRGIADSSAVTATALADLQVGAANGATAANLDSVVLSAQLYDGDTAVSTVKSPSTGVITFDNMNWTIPAGSTKKLVVKTNLSTTQLDGNADSFVLFLGIGDITAQDKDGNVLSNVPAAQVNATANLATATSITTTVSANGTLSAAADGATPLSAIALSGSTDVSFLKVRLTASTEAFQLNRLRVRQTVTNASEGLATIKIKYPKADGTTATATSTLSGGLADFSGLNGYLALDKASVVEVLADIGTIRDAGISGDAPILQLDGTTATGLFEAVGVGSGTTVSETTLNTGVSGNAMTLRKTKPTVTLSASSGAGTAVPGILDVLKFTVSADAAGDVILRRVTFKVNTTDNATVSTSWNQASTASSADAGNIRRVDFSIYDATDTSTQLEAGDGDWALYNVAGTTQLQGASVGATVATAVVGYARVTLTTPVTISAGTSKTFLVKFDATGASSVSHDTIRFDVSDETSTVGVNADTSLTSSAGEFVWDEINTTSLAGSATLITGTNVKSLPVNGNTFSL